MSVASRARQLFILTSLLCTACGGDPRPAGDHDDMLGEDAGTMSGSDDDAGSSGPVTSVPRCKVDPSELSIKLAVEGASGWDAFEWNDTVHLAYQVPVCSDDATPGERIDYLTFQSTGAFAEPRPVAGEGQCSHTQAPVLGPGEQQNPVLLYTSDAGGSSELYQAQLGTGESAAQLTLDAQGEGEEHAVLVPFGSSNLLAYVNTQVQQVGPSIGQIVTRRVGFAEQEIVSAESRSHITDLALGAFSSDSELGGVLAWITNVSEQVGIFAQRLDRAGKPVDGPVLLSSQVGALSNVSILMLPKGAHEEMAGIIAYGVSPRGANTELRFRTVSLDGSIGDEQPLTTGAINAQGIGIAYYASGYALVYRVILENEAWLHVRVVDVLGNTTSYGELLLVPCAPGGDPPEAFVTTDGRLTVVFSERTAEGTTLRAVRAICDY